MKTENQSRKNLPYTRLLFIDKKIAEKSYPNSVSLAKEYEVSIITIKRDIETMRTMLHAPIEYDFDKKGYYYEKEMFRLPALFSTQAELVAAGIISKVMAQYANTPMYKHVLSIFNGLQKMLTGSDTAKNPLWFEKRISFLDEPVPLFTESIWNDIMSAMHTNVCIDFSYKGAWNKDKKRYVLAPYQLVTRRGVWYCALYSDIHDNVTLYALHRISTLKVTDKTFEMSADFDYARDYGGGFGIFAKGKAMQCKVRFFDEAVTYIGERKWTKDQKIDEHDDGSITLTFTSSQLYETLSWILSQGENALPLEPPELRAQWENSVREMGKMSKGKIY